jgi:hypothetical protein
VPGVAAGARAAPNGSVKAGEGARRAARLSLAVHGFACALLEGDGRFVSCSGGQLIISGGPVNGHGAVRLCCSELGGGGGRVGGL